jgi:dihydrodipicolinate synthase/N-acetylneuraminate lyase
MTSKLRGVVIPSAVPLGQDQSLDRAGLGRLVEFLINSGVHGIFVNGSMGAFALLPDRLQLEVIETVVDLVHGRVPVLAGASETGTSRVLEKVRQVERIGADAVVVMPPFFYFCPQTELLRFFLQVADTCGKPLILYDNPRLTKNPIDVKTIERLAVHPNVRGLKITTEEVLKWQEVLRADIPRDKFSLFAGAERMTSLALQLGFDGIIGGLHNVIPELAVRLYQTVRQGNFSEADAIQQKINRVYRLFEVDGGWRGLETAFQHMGICRKVTAPPYDVELPEEKRRKMLEILAEEGVVRPYPPLPSHDEEAAGKTGAIPH